MKALSIKQPWAWMILNKQIGKDIENRNWMTKFRGRVLIHASGGCARWQFDHAIQFMLHAAHFGGAIYPSMESMSKGGIVGSVEIVDCVKEHSSPWFDGSGFGFVLKDPRPCTFIQMKGKLGFFDVPDSVATMAGCM